MAAFLIEDESMRIFLLGSGERAQFEHSISSPQPKTCKRFLNLALRLPTSPLLLTTFRRCHIFVTPGYIESANACEPGRCPRPSPRTIPRPSTRICEPMRRRIDAIIVRSAQASLGGCECACVRRISIVCICTAWKHENYLDRTLCH